MCTDETWLRPSKQLSLMGIPNQSIFHFSKPLMLAWNENQLSTKNKAYKVAWNTQVECPLQINYKHFAWNTQVTCLLQVKLSFCVGAGV